MENAVIVEKDVRQSLRSPGLGLPAKQYRILMDFLFHGFNELSGIKSYHGLYSLRERSKMTQVPGSIHGGLVVCMELDVFRIGSSRIMCQLLLDAEKSTADTMSHVHDSLASVIACFFISIKTLRGKEDI
jgi:hypothetical protein